VNTELSWTYSLPKRAGTGKYLSENTRKTAAESAAAEDQDDDEQVDEEGHKVRPKGTAERKADKTRWQTAFAELLKRGDDKDLEHEQMIVLLELANLYYGKILPSGTTSSECVGRDEVTS
jgi:hypothetical protein